MDFGATQYVTDSAGATPGAPRDTARGMEPALASARSSARGTARGSGTARSAAALAAVPLSARSARSARSATGVLDSVRSDMSTARLENSLTVLQAEKADLAARLAAIDEQLMQESRDQAAAEKRKTKALMAASKGRPRH